MFRKLKEPVIWYELLLFIIVVFLGLGLYQMGYNKGFDDGGKYVIDRLKEKLEKFEEQNPAPPTRHKEKRGGIMS